MSTTELPFRVAEAITRGGTTFEVLEYGPLAGTEPFAVAAQVFTLNRSGVRLRQLRIRLSTDAVRTEPGALQFLKGNIEMESSTGAGSGLGGLMKGALAAARTGETVFKPLYRGTGEMYLEPTFGHLWLMQMEGGTLYADQGLFACCEDSVKVEAHKVESFSARIAGGEGRYQTKVSGSGMVVFRVPVPRRPAGSPCSATSGVDDDSCRRPGGADDRDSSSGAGEWGYPGGWGKLVLPGYGQTGRRVKGSRDPVCGRGYERRNMGTRKGLLHDGGWGRVRGCGLRARLPDPRT